MSIKKLMYIIPLGLFLMFQSTLIAQDSVKVNNQNQNNEQEKEKIEHGLKFVDEDGDGFNDNAPDHDGDGIPNGLDPDYKGKGKRKHFIDLDGDGINDNIYRENQKGQRRGFWPANNDATQPANESQQKGKSKKHGRR